MSRVQVGIWAPTASGFLSPRAVEDLTDQISCTGAVTDGRPDLISTTSSVAPSL